MGEKTDNFNFSLIEVLSDLQDSYNGDITLIDSILKILGSPNDGTTVTVAEPSVAAGAATAIGGDLPSDTEYFYAYTYVDPANGLESAPSPEVSIETPADFFPPDAPSLVSTVSGGSLTPGTYSYVLSYWSTFQTFETSAFNTASIVLHPGDGSDQQVTISMPALGDATGFNIYRRRPGSSSYYFIGSQTGAADFVDDGSGPEDCERFAPVTSNILSTHAIEVTIPSLPTGLDWRLYRSTTSGDFTNSLVATITDDSLSYIDLGGDVSLRTPPAMTHVLVPGNVGLRSGADDPGVLDGNDGDWWINTVSLDLFGPKDSGAWAGAVANLAGGSGGGGVFRFDPTVGSSYANVYKTWPEVVTALATVVGPKQIEIVGNITIDSTGMPGGGWDLNGAGFISELASLDAVITVADGVKFINPGLVLSDGVTLYSTSTGSVIDMDGGTLWFKRTYLLASTAAMFNCVNDATIILDFGTAITVPSSFGLVDGDYEAVEIPTGESLTLILGMGSTLGDDVLRGAGTAGALRFSATANTFAPDTIGETQTNLTTWNGFLEQSTAHALRYDATTSGDWAEGVPVTAEDALDKLAARAGGSGAARPTAMYSATRKGRHVPVTIYPDAGSSQSGSGSAGYAIWWPCYVDRSVLVTPRHRVRTGSSSGLIRHALWTFDMDTLEPGTFVEDLGTISANVADGTIVVGSESTVPVSGYFYLAIWTANEGTARYTKTNQAEYSGARMFGISDDGGGAIRGWRTTGVVDYSSAWNTTLPSLDPSDTISHTDDPFPTFTPVAA